MASSASTVYYEDTNGELQPVVTEMVTDSPWDECVPGQALIKREQPGGDPLTFLDTWEPIGASFAGTWHSTDACEIADDGTPMNEQYFEFTCQDTQPQHGEGDFDIGNIGDHDAAWNVIPKSSSQTMKFDNASDPATRHSTVVYDNGEQHVMGNSSSQIVMLQNALDPVVRHSTTASDGSRRNVMGNNVSQRAQTRGHVIDQACDNTPHKDINADAVHAELASTRAELQEIKAMISDLSPTASPVASPKPQRTAQLCSLKEAARARFTTPLSCI